jgi:hypothetical protein
MDVSIEPLLWEGGGPSNPDIPAFSSEVTGEGPQAVIDRQLWDDLGGYDVYLGIIWRRMGTPVAQWRSGTEAEYRSAHLWKEQWGRPSTILFYQKHVDVDSDMDSEQLALVRSFTRELQGEGLVQRFTDAESLRSLLIPHLTRAVRKAQSKTEDTDRLAALEELERESRGRCVMRWQGAGLSRKEAYELAQDASVGAPSTELRRFLHNPIALLTAEVGAGKSLTTERLLQMAISEAREVANCPVPVYLDARRVEEGRLREAVEEKASDLGTPNRQGARVFVDVEEGEIDRTITLLDDARVLVETWPETSVVIASRPIPGLFSTDEVFEIPQLSEAEAHEIVGRLTGYAVTAAVSYRWPASVRDAIRRPLFAVLLGIYEREQREMEVPRSRGELVSSIVERALERAGGDIEFNQEKLERLAAISTDRGGLVPGAEVSFGADLRRLQRSGLVVERSGALGFPLPILTEWFAAHSLASGYPRPDELAADERRLEVWRHSLVIGVGRFSSDQVTEFLEPIASRSPAFAADIVNDGLARWGTDEEVSLPPPLEAGTQLRTAMVAWVRGIGPLAAIAAPVRQDGTLAPVGVATNGTWADVGWYRGDRSSESVIRLPIEARFNPDWFPMRSGATAGHQSAWAWRWTLEDLTSSLQKVMTTRGLPVKRGMLAQEAAWQMAILVTGHAPSREEPIPLGDIEPRLDGLMTHTDMVRDPRGRRYDLHDLREQLLRCRDEGVAELHPPWPGPDCRLTDDESRTGPWDAYSDEGLLNRAVAVYEGALDGYRRLVEQWFPAFTPRLQTAMSLPARFTGIIVRRMSFTGDGDRTPLLFGYLQPLPYGSDTVVDLRLSTNSSAYEKLYEDWSSNNMAHVRALRSEAPGWLGSTFEQRILDVFNSGPCTELAYNWLWRDLKRVAWVRGLFPRQFW